MSYLYDLADRRPELFSKHELDRLVGFKDWASDIMRRADEAQLKAETLDGRPKHQKLLTPGKKQRLDPS